MKWKYKTLMLLTLLIFCVGSVCAADPDPTDPIVKKLIDDNNQLTIKVYNQSKEINQLKDNNTQLDKRVKTLEESNKELEYSKNTQSNRIKALEESNKQKDIDIKELKDSNKQLIEDNKALNSKVDNQSVIINELNIKLENQLNEINKLQAEKDKLQAEKCSIYERLLESPKKEDFEKLKKEIKDKNKQIEKLNNEIKILRAINSVSKKDVVKSLKDLSSSTNIKNVKCGEYTFKLADYLKIPLIKNGKNDVLKFKKDNGRLPNHVTIAGYKVPQKVYKKLFNI